MIKTYLNWKLKKSSNYNVDFFMSKAFQKMLRGQVAGELIEGQSVFSTKLQKSENNHKIQCFD